MASVHVSRMVDFLKGTLSLDDTRSPEHSDGVRAIIAKTIIVAHPKATLQGDEGTTYHIPYSIDALLQAIYPMCPDRADVDLVSLKKLLIDTEFVAEVGDESLICTSIAFVRTVEAYRSLRTGGLAAFYTQHHPQIGVV